MDNNPITYEASPLLEALTQEGPDLLARLALRREELETLFPTLSTLDYGVMWLLHRCTRETDKLYLKDLAAQLQLPIDRASKLAKALQQRGLVTWTHDGDGSEGTYLQLTQGGKDAALAQRARLTEYSRSVVQAYGEEDFLYLVQNLRRLEAILHQEAEKARDDHD